jgi:spore photoproduct lyase
MPEEVWIERSEVETPLARTVLSRIGSVAVRVADDVSGADLADFRTGKRRLVLQRQRGAFVRACPAGTAGLVCCNYLVLNFASNCPLDCSYCFLQEYVANNPAVKAYTNVRDALDEIHAVLRAHPERTFRIGTGELADSLALDPLTGLSAQLIPFFATQPNAVLELKTKTDDVGELLAFDPRERVVVSWSVNAPAIMAGEEHGTARLAERLAAAVRVQRAGYRLGFHFDPLVEHDGWEAGYRDTVERVFAAVDASRVAWVSLGSLRLTPRLAAAIRARGHGARVLAGELVPSGDGKARVWFGLRRRMYQTVIGAVRAAAPAVPLYLCMESPAMWTRVMGEAPADRDVARRLAAGAAW